MMHFIKRTIQLNLILHRHRSLLFSKMIGTILAYFLVVKQFADEDASNCDNSVTDYSTFTVTYMNLTTYPYRSENSILQFILKVR